MIRTIRNPVWMTTIMVLVIAMLLVASALIAANKPGAGACTMRGGTAVCPMGGGKSMPMMAKGSGGCMVVDARVLSVNKDGSYTVRVKPSGAAKAAFAGLKAGSKAPLMALCGSGNCAMPKGKMAAGCPMNRPK
jgi:hypothetical protein